VTTPLSGTVCHP